MSYDISLVRFYHYGLIIYLVLTSTQTFYTASHFHQIHYEKGKIGFFTITCCSSSSSSSSSSSIENDNQSIISLSSTSINEVEVTGVIPPLYPAIVVVKDYFTTILIIGNLKFWNLKFLFSLITLPYYCYYCYYS